MPPRYQGFFDLAFASRLAVEYQGTPTPDSRISGNVR